MNMKYYLLIMLAALMLGACSEQEDLPPIVEVTTTTVAPPLNQVAKNSTVHVVIKKGARGSGVYLGQSFVLTAGHVCREIKRKPVTVVSVINKEVINVVAYAIDKRYPKVDLCVLKLQTPSVDLTPIKFATVEAQIGDTVYLPSFAGGQAYSLRAGQVLGEESITIDKVTFLVTVTSIYAEPGASGGGVLNSSKELTGIMVVSYFPAGNGGYEPLSDIQSFLQQQLGLFF